MEAKDTVMSSSQTRASFSNYGCDYDGDDKKLHPLVENIQERQAEISFNAGQVQAKKEQYIVDWAHEGEAVKQARQAGIREVVEWLINDSYDTTIHFGEDWQAKLKKWGL